MKRLYLVRHAKSSWEDSSLDDIDRPLNNRGKRDAPEMGSRLRKNNLKPEILISSPAKRARSTAKKISTEIDYPRKEILIDDRIYHGGVNQLIEVVREISDHIESAMLFGHNPGLTEFANRLCGVNIFNVPTAGIVAVDFRIDHWKEADYGIGELVFFDYPKKKS